MLKKMMKMMQYRQLVDISLTDKMKQIENNPPPIPGFKISRMKYLIHLILSHKVGKGNFGAYSKLNMQIMKNIVPRADKYLNYLKKEGIIEWINYSAGHNSRQYRLVNEGKTEFRTITDKNLVKRIEISRAKLKSHNSRKYPLLNKWIRQTEIDFEGALATIEEEYSKSEQDDHAIRRRTFCLAEIEKIRSGQIFITVNTTNYRLDSNFTRLPSTLLKHLHISGNSVIEMDIRNAQPFFASALINPTPEIEKLISSYLTTSVTKKIKSFQLGEYDDVMEYIRLVSEGEFYNYMAELFEKENIHFSDRKELKEKLFVVFFGPRFAYKYSNAAEVFKRHFPHVHKLFDFIKQKEYNRLAILLQRIESYTMLERVVKKIQKRVPDLPILTRHDSILVFKPKIFEPHNLDRIRIILTVTIEQVIGIAPQGRMSRFSLE